jgi:hypothetical protein
LIILKDTLMDGRSWQVWRILGSHFVLVKGIEFWQFELADGRDEKNSKFEILVG